MGRPYRVQTMQLIRVARYGASEYCSTDPFFHIRMKVGIGDKNKKSEMTFPMMPTTVRAVSAETILVRKLAEE
jgi:hypothetical protein